MHKIDLKENKSFCILPFVHLHVNEKNDIKLCCLADGQTVKKYTKDFDFVNDPEMQEVRRKMLSGERIKHCTKCYEYEDARSDSSRIRDTAEWMHKLNLDHVENVITDLVYYDIRNDNLCNLSCRMCSPQFSSQLEKEYKEIGWFFNDLSKKEAQGLNDIVDLNTVKMVYVAGGEPSLMQGFRLFLKRAIAARRTDIKIRMNTNATNLNKEYRELLAQFTNLEIICSIDGYDQVNRYIRWPTDWESLVSNLRGISAITPTMAFNVTVSIWNISQLSKLIEFFDNEFPNNTVLLNQVYGKQYLQFTTFPNKELALLDLAKCKQSRRYVSDASFASKLDFFTTEIQNNKVNLVALSEFFQYNDTLDKSRNIKLQDYIPELEQCRDLIKKPI
jgi:sulfatase maturation enzyme AslB (radical SAM superfamily)